VIRRYKRMDKSGIKTTDSWKSLYRVGGAAALILGILFLIAVLSLIISVLQPGTMSGWLMPIQNNWLIVLFKINANFSGFHTGLLYCLNLLDSVILVLGGAMFLGLYAALRQTSKIWAIIAAVQPFIGIPLFIVTKVAGRLGIMGAGLVISFVMLRSNNFSKATAVMGILASGLLIAGDICTSDAPSIMIAVLIAIGYVLMVTWFFVISRRLFQLGQNVSKEDVIGVKV
jgi:hypothetical protein